MINLIKFIRKNFLKGHRNMTTNTNSVGYDSKEILQKVTK